MVRDPLRYDFDHPRFSCRLDSWCAPLWAARLLDDLSICKANMLITLLTITFGLACFALGFLTRCWQEDRILERWHTKMCVAAPWSGAASISLEL